MKLIILNGPTGTGKNTIAELVADKRHKVAIVDFDDIRKMFIKPHKTPWDGEEGRFQQLLGVEHVCRVSESFAQNHFDVIILDVLSDETANLYKERLTQFNPILIFLLPTFEEIKRRNLTRPPRLTPEELEMVYKDQKELKVYDHLIDNSGLSPKQAANQVNLIMDNQ